MSEQAIHLVITIVDRGRKDKVLAVCHANRAPVSAISHGHGTARTETLDLLGIGETQKNIVLSPVPEPAVGRLLDEMAAQLKMRYPGNGIAFSVPMTSISGRIYRTLTRPEPGSEERSQSKMETQGKFEMVAVLINRGFTDLVMDAARQEGAPGGTVLNSRGFNSPEAEQFMGISIQEEKELIFMVVPAEKRPAVMQAILRAAGLKTPAKGLVFSLPVSHAIGLSD